MRRLCVDGAAHGSRVGTNATLAAFLVALAACLHWRSSSRSPLAYIGYQQNSGDSNWSPLFELDVGVPMGLCEEGPAGVFTRAWSNGTAALDCATWTGALPFVKRA